MKIFTSVGKENREEIGKFWFEEGEKIGTFGKNIYPCNSVCNTYTVMKNPQISSAKLRSISKRILSNGFERLILCNHFAIYRYTAKVICYRKLSMLINAKCSHFCLSHVFLFQRSTWCEQNDHAAYQVSWDHVNYVKQDVRYHAYFFSSRLVLCQTW